MPSPSLSWRNLRTHLLVSRSQRLGVAMSMLTSIGVVTFPAAPVVAAVATPASCSEAAATDDVAMARAKACSRDVEVSSRMSETTRVVAQPSGRLRSEQFVSPVRVRRDTGWTPVDTNLRAQTDGGLVPQASTVDMRFSKGGNDPLVTVRAAGGSATMTWPAALPVPSIEGDTAVYSGVFANVDLRVRATATGFTHVLVVRNRAAADNPALRSIRYGWTGSGLTVRPRPDDGFDLVDRIGQIVLVSGDGQMWDSTNGDLLTGKAAAMAGVEDGQTASDAAPSTPDSAGDLAKVAPVQLTATASELIIAPDVDLLTAADVVFPLYIDPPVNATRQKYAYANKNGNLNNDEYGRVGKNPTGSGIWRSFFQFELAGVAYKPITSAKVNGWVYQSHLCTSAEPTGLWHTGNIPDSVANGRNTAWSPALIQHLAEAYGRANYGAACSQGDDRAMQWQDPILLERVQAWANSGWSYVTLGLSGARRYDAGYEDNVNSWKRFLWANTSMTIEYNFTPNVPAPQQFNNQTDCHKVCSSSTVASSAGKTEGWWRLNEASGTTATDSSSAARHGTLSGGASWSDSSAVFNGSTTQIATATPALDTTQSFTVSAWAKVADTGFGGTVLGQDASWRAGFELFYNGGDNWGFVKPYGDGNWGGAWLGGSTPTTTSTWVHLAAVYDRSAGVARLYVNGTLTDTQSAGWDFPATGGLTIGRGKYNSVPSGYFKGSIDNVQVYQRAVAAADVTVLRDAGRGGGAIEFKPAIVRKAEPTFLVNVSDPDSGARLRTEYEIRVAATEMASVVAAVQLPEETAPSGVTWAPPAGTLVHGSIYYWRARSTDEMSAVGGWTPFQAVTIDTAPPVTPSASSLQFPYKQWGAELGTTGTFTFTAATGEDIEFLWEKDFVAQSSPVSGTGTSPTTATVTWQPTTDGVHTVRVSTKDMAGNPSTGYYDHTFYVSSDTERFSHWKLDESSGTNAADSGNAITVGGALAPGTLSAEGVGFTAGKNAGGVTFTGDAAITTSGPVLDTTKSFTVMAWVKPSSLNADMTAVSHDGDVSSRFQLHFDKEANTSSGGWCFGMRPSEGAAMVSACTDGADLGFPVVDVWVHLAGVYDALNHTIRIYVMGDPFTCFDSPAETAVGPFAGTWSATGSLAIGRSKAGGEGTAYWRGGIDDVFAHQRVLSTTEICMQAQP